MLASDRDVRGLAVRAEVDRREGQRRRRVPAVGRVAHPELATGIVAPADQGALKHAAGG